MSLLQDVLRTQTLDSLDKKLNHSQVNGTDNDSDSDHELIDVVSIPGTPASRSRPASRPSSRPSSRTTSPSRAAARALKTQLHISSASHQVASDPLKAFPTNVSQRIFSYLSIRDLARCSRVCRKWNKSQTLNYVWFQHYRKENFHDESLPPGKWTKRESKQNWRLTYLSTIPNRDPPAGVPSRSASRPHSGAQTPKEMREEKWKQEAEGVVKPSKVEMREMYKELGGRKPKTKGKVGSAVPGSRDKGGWGEDAGGEFW
ncbi:hypothetical protein K474DRAFT_1663651 [Panus rudis PR-1116 ss-1]|nr:hypothetical protein K474DRAFT_1663651 [Panus rudis PR-1116 ss-1]